MRKIVFFILLVSFYSFSQKTEFYPSVTSFQEISSEDSALIVGQESRFKEASNDTLKMAVLETVADQCTNSEIAYVYLKSLQDFAKQSYQGTSTSSAWNQKVAYFHGASYYTTAFRQKDQGKYQEAKKNYLEALKIFEKYGLMWAVGMTYNSIGFISDNGKDGLGESIKYYKKALDVFKKLDDVDQMGSVLLNLASMASDLDQKELTFKYLFEAVEIAKEYKNDFYMAVAYSELARNYRRFDIDTANNIELLEKSIALHIQLKTYRNANIALIDLAREHYDKFRDLKKADSILQRAIYYAEKIDYPSGIAEAQYRLGCFYTKEGDMKTAQALMEKAYLYTKNTNDSRFTHTVAENIHKVYAVNQEWEKAYEALLYEHKYSVKHLTNENKLKLSEQRLEYDYEKQKEIDELKHLNELAKEKEEKRQQKIIITISLVSLGVFLVLLTFIFNRLRVIRKQKKALDQAYELLEVQKNNELALSNLKALRSQMNPHFVFNSLNSIQDLILQQETNKSYDYIVLFADLVRSALNYSQKEFIPIDKEIEFLKVYLQLEKLRFGDEFEYNVELHGSDEVKVPSLVIQPFIENALLHGLLHKDGLKKLQVKFEVTENLLICTIEDNGIGRNRAKEIKDRQGSGYSSFSTKAIKERLEILSKQYDVNTGFEYENIVLDGIISGTRVIVNLPFKEF